MRSTDDDGPTAWAPSPEVILEMPMTTPPEVGTCPCLRPAGPDGFCEEHAGAVAFRVPIGPTGEVHPARWWHWGHSRPCPHGEGWLLAASPIHGRFRWACPHRSHGPGTGGNSEDETCR